MLDVDLRDVSLLLSLLTLHRAEAGFTLEQGIPHFNTKPYFLPLITQNITALRDQSAYIQCRVAQLGNKKVSWIRGRDLHVLTSGLLTFSSDERFIPVHQDRSENWTLHIRYSQRRDSGEYQCQINSQPKKSTSFYLTVKEATTNIAGAPQRYVKAGSSINMLCTTSAGSSHPGLVYWYRNREVLTAGESVSIDSRFEEESVSSELVVKSVTEEDSGNYTCWPTKFHPASVILHVIPGEDSAAMSHGTLSSNGGISDASNTSTLHNIQKILQVELPLFILCALLQDNTSFVAVFHHYSLRGNLI